VCHHRVAYLSQILIFLQTYRFRRRAGHSLDSDNFLLPRGPPYRDRDPPPGHQHGQPPHPGPKKPDDPADPPESPNDPGGMDHYFFLQIVRKFKLKVFFP